MQRFSTNVSRIMAFVVVVALAIFIVENLFQIRAQFLGLTFTASLWWIVVGSALLGSLCAFLLLAPGRIAVGWRNRTIVHEQARHELDSLRSQNATRANWDEERTALTAENQRLQAQKNPSQALTQQDPSQTQKDLPAIPTAVER